MPDVGMALDPSPARVNQLIFPAIMGGVVSLLLLCGGGIWACLCWRRRWKDDRSLGRDVTIENPKGSMNNMHAE